jgi:hypothetical protein
MNQPAQSVVSPPSTGWNWNADWWRGPAYAFSLLVLVSGTVWLARNGLSFKPGSDVGYNIGLVGSIFMLLLLLYPARKRVRWMHTWLPMKHWFRAHMFLGVAGPLLVVLHSTLTFGSINSIIAFFCMSLVAVSGLIGRFIYVRIHHGLYGRRKTLQELKEQQSIGEQNLRTKFHFSPQLEQRLHQFEAMALAPDRGLLRNAWRFVALGPVAVWTYHQSCRDLLHSLQQMGVGEAMPRELKRRYAYGKAFIRTYLKSVQAASQFQTYERLFSLWHVVHIPLMFLLVITGVIHVIAVHMY